jgi:NDP-sugar pyrophosphorylase family protein
MRAVILAGGKGTRLAPFTTILPKPLMPIGDYPILEVVIRQLRRAGFDRITMAVGHLGELIEAFFGNGEKWGMRIDYSREDKPLGTAGPLGLIGDLRGDFLVMNGDILTDLDFKGFMDYHRRNGALATIGIFNKVVKIDLGIVTMGGGNQIYDYVEKPELAYQVSMGVSAFNQKVLDFIPRGKYLDIPDLIKMMVKRGLVVKGYPFNGYWLDIGRKEDYEVAVDRFEQMRGIFPREEP